MLLYSSTEAANDNPLSLLGQYSDDEADEDDNPSLGPTNNIGNEAGEDFTKNQDEQENAASILVTGKILDEKETTSSLVLGEHNQESKSFSVSESRFQYMETTENEWQAVLHEDTGEYYYWNILTGETTWVKPVSLESTGFDTSSVKSSELLQKEIHREDDRGESGEPDTIPTSENGSQRVESCLLQSNPAQDAEPENAITCLESSTFLEAELDCSKAQIKSVPDSGGDAAIEKAQDLEDRECVAGSDDFAEGQHAKELQGEEMDEEKTLVAIKLDGEDVKSEALEAIQGALEISSQPEKRFEVEDTKSHDRNFPLAGESLQETQMGNSTLSDSQDAPECTRNLYTKRTIQEKMVSLGEMGDALQQRLNILARDSLGGVPRHAHMALQAEARITDWKAFCALGFDPEACLSFIQNELTQLESVIIAEEAIELGRRKVVQSTTALEASHEVGPARNDADWSLNWGYYQQESSTLPGLWKQGQPTEFLGNGEDVEEGEIQTSYGEIHAAYSSIPEGLTTVNKPKGSNGEDVDMDVDMEVDDEVEAEPAVPGVSSDVPSHVSYSYPYSLGGSNDVGALAPLDTSLVGEPTHYFPVVPSGDSWAPPLPPDDEWAPPPPGETEPAPPPPPDEPPPLPPHSPQLVETGTMLSVPSEVQVHYLVPEYTLGNNPLPQHICAPDYQSVLDASVYGAFVEDVPGAIYSNSPQPTEALKVEQPYVLASVSSSAFNGWSAPVLATAASSVVNPVLASEASVKSTSYVPSVRTASSTTADNSAGGAISEAKKLAKGKVKKRTHAVAAAPMLNKKVSSLVSKWKQAKEELHGGEDDEDDKALYDVEILEKKRQKEIEEWRRQQIASGEALDNANFQPLGTIDWRERVKRAKRADSKERKEGDTGSEAPLSRVEGQNQEALKSQNPNLSDLSKGLPAGWQVYWDEASGEVYYGNLITQETTWDRPVT